MDATTRAIQGRKDRRMSDLISRQAAIDALGERPMVWVGSDYELGARNQYDADVLALETVPSAQPERKSGRWIEDGYNNYKAVCSECGEPCGTYVMGKPRDNFCKWCGAKMEADT